MHLKVIVFSVPVSDTSVPVTLQLRTVDYSDGTMGMEYAVIVPDCTEQIVPLHYCDTTVFRIMHDVEWQESLLETLKAEFDPSEFKGLTGA